MSMMLDNRDAAVIDQLDPGETVPRHQLEALFRQHTDIRNPRTLERRILDLVETEYFELVDYGVWRYLGRGSR